MSWLIKKDDARPITVRVIDADAAPVASLTLTSSWKWTKSGGTIANAAGTLTDRTLGVYEYTPTAGEVDTLGNAILSFADTTNGYISVGGSVQVVAVDPRDATAFGISRIDQANSADTSGTTTLLSRIPSTLTISGGVVQSNVVQIDSNSTAATYLGYFLLGTGHLNGVRLSAEQWKVVIDSESEFAVHIENTNGNGIAEYIAGGYGQYIYGNIAGQFIYGDGAGQYIYGDSAGQYIYGVNETAVRLVTNGTQNAYTINGVGVNAPWNTTTPPSAAANASAVRTELATELARIDVATSTRATPAQILTNTANTLLTNTAGYVTTTDGGTVAVSSFTSTAATQVNAIETNTTTLLARIGAFTGTGVNTILGFLKAIMSKDASTPSDVGGTFAASTDSTEAIRDRGDAAWITGTTGLSGPSSVTLTFQDSGAAAVPLVDFTIVGQGSARANASGVAAFGLADGTYTVVSRPTAGIMFANATLTVSGTTTQTITGTTAAPAASTTATQTNAYITTYDGAGNIMSGVEVVFWLATTPTTTGSYRVNRVVATSSGTSANNLQVNLLRNTLYKAQRGKGPIVSFTTGSGTTYALPSILGEDHGV